MANKLSRRTFLGATATGAGIVAASPWMWVKKSFAQSTPGFGTAKHLLVMYAQGGLRSAPLFNAEAAFQHNPFGRSNSTAEWGVGKILGETRIPLFTFGEQLELPTVAEIGSDIAVIAGVDHEPGTDRAVLDHDMGDYGVTTGDIEGNDAGLLSRIHKDHPGYVNGTARLPPIDIGLSRFGRGEGEYTGFRPIAVQSAENFRGRSEGEVRETTPWARDLRLTRDERFIGKRAPFVAPYLGAVRDAKINAREYAQALRNSALDLLEVPDAELGGVSNQQLLEVLGGGPFGGSQWGLEVGFALRMMQLGVPAMAVTRYLTEAGIPIYDTHSDEKTLFPIDAADLGRQITGLRFLMKRMVDADGDNLWDKTVVVMMSEFSRDNADPQTGFNSANGSDHQGGISSRNQIWPIFGGPVKAAGKRIGGLNPNTMEAADGKRIATVRSVHATLLAFLGIDASRHFADLPILALMG